MKDTPRDIRGAVEQSLAQLVAKERYRSITVSDICEGAHISRHTFYEYYSNKEDVIAMIFHRDVIAPLEDFQKLFSSQERRSMDQLTEILLTKMYQRIKDNGEFYHNLVRPMKGKDDAFIRIVTNAIYEFDINLLEKTDFSGNQIETDYTAYLFASSQAMFMQKWIASNYDIPTDELASIYAQFTNPFWLSRTS